MKPTSPTLGRPPKRHLDNGSAGHKTLEHLVHEGPFDVELLRDHVEGLLSTSDRTDATRLLRRLTELGFIRTKVWLTPEGMAELGRLGWKPRPLEVGPPGSSGGALAEDEPGTVAWQGPAVAMHVSPTVVLGRTPGVAIGSNPSAPVEHAETHCPVCLAYEAGGVACGAAPGDMRAWCQRAARGPV